MMDIRPPRCPKCDHKMRVMDGRERTVRGGVWYVLVCPRCLYTFDTFKPRRSKRDSGK